MNSFINKSSLNDNMIEISKTLETLKNNSFNLEKEIDKEEHYKQGLIEKIKNFENEILKLDCKINLNFSKYRREGFTARSV
jgi:predicted  nucleic acid-binding Zn-ribbon protein